MALHHQNPPTLSKPTAKSRQQLKARAPYSDQPPNKRPRIAEKPSLAVMTATGQHRAWTENTLEPLLMYNDEVVIEDMEAELKHHRFGWTLDDELNIFRCKDKNCRACPDYRKHVVERLCLADEPDAGDEDGDIQDGDSEDGESEDGDDESSAGSGEELDSNGNDKCAPGVRSERMMQLIRLRDLKCRRDAFEGDGDDRAKGSMEGMLVTVQTDKLRLQAECDRANSSWSIAEEALAKLRRTHSSLKDSHEATTASLATAVAEIAQLKDQLAAAVAAAKWQCPDESAKVWEAMNKPTSKDPPQLLACWLQFHEERNPLGVPFLDESKAIDLRNIRGYNEVRARTSQSRSAGNSDRAKRQKRMSAMTDLLARPGVYKNLIHSHNLSIAPRATYSPLALKEPYTDVDVAKLLAAQGMTFATADDTWRYCHAVLQEAAAHDQSNVAENARRLLADIESMLLDVPPPPGKTNAATDRFERPHTLPWKTVKHAH
ncbi:hypothetical protein DFH06DRAFT_1323570 [Mycena polygramma]|nr:hypothetical protein DFH06DRAFT_1323570 [Mycena polygramma]